MLKDDDHDEQTNINAEEPEETEKPKEDKPLAEIQTIEQEIVMLKDELKKKDVNFCV